jgi:hypothetical protein
MRTEVWRYPFSKFVMAIELRLSPAQICHAQQAYTPEFRETVAPLPGFGRG